MTREPKTIPLAQVESVRALVEAASVQLATKARRDFNVRKLLFGPQLEFVADTAPFATGLCSRRAGKTLGGAAWLLEGPIEKPHAPSLYITETRIAAKRRVWAMLLRLNREYGLGFAPKEGELILSRDGEDMVYLAGVDNKTEIEKIRGTGWNRVLIDESQNLPQYVKELVEDVLMPSLMDHGGQLRMVGTPAPVPVGYFYDATKSSEWTHHGWTCWQNPHLPKAREMLDKVLRVRGVTLEDPSVRREWFGEWAYDPNALVFRWTPANGYSELPGCASPWQYVIGVDLGFDDSDAIAVLAFNDASPACYLVEEWTGSKQGITPLARQLEEALAKYSPLSIVIDSGGLGKKIAHEITMRTAIPLKPAEKDRKYEFIELLNDALRTGRFYAKSDGKFARDAMLLEWDSEKSTGDKLKISDRYHSDICDATLYAYRESLHWLHQAPKPKPSIDEWKAQQEAEMIAELERRIQQEREEEMWQ